jgi:two-component sensor histidine kinase
MLSAGPRRFAALPTAAKLLLILTAVLLPIGIALVAVGESGIREADRALRGHSHDEARTTAAAIESLIARNALAMRIAAGGAISAGGNACDRAAQALATAPAISRRFSLRTTDGDILCTSGGFVDRNAAPLVAPGAIRLWLDPAAREIDIRAGVTGGMATASLPLDDLRTAAQAGADAIAFLSLTDGRNRIALIGGEGQSEAAVSYSDWPIANGDLTIRVGMPVARITTIDRLVLLLPVLMWVLAALIVWVLVGRLLIRPLKQLQRAVIRYDPGESLDLPRKLGPSREIQELRDAFGRAVNRVDESERDMASALDGQRRLVREVHHRVKNNLQVVASLLNIHGRSAETPDARAAYAGIGRRVGALSVVHRNHFAEMEENRGISLRPLLTELAAELRAGAPDSARGFMIELDLESAFTTQDVAVAVAFLVTEIVEYAMLRAPQQLVEVSLRRTSELTASLTIASPVLVPEDADKPDKVQFERILGGLAKQLRSTLDRKLGRYSVELPVFPAA